MMRLFSRARRERELDEEVRSHFEMAIQERVERGEPREEAERAVRREFGDAGRVKEVTRTMWGDVWLDRILRDLRYALRGVRRAPGFASAVVLSLALGVGATTTVFTFVDAILLRPLPYPDPERLVAMGHEAAGLDVLEAQQSDGTYLHYRANSRAFEEIATYYENVVNLSGADGVEAERVPIAMVSSSFFSVLGARTVVGRLPNEEEAPRMGGATDPNDPDIGAAADGTVEVLLSFDLWRRTYGADPDIVGRMIEANRAPRRVIGVLEAGFAFPRPEIGIWYPEDPDPARARALDMYKHGIGRLRPGFTVADAERDLDRLIPLLPEAYPDLTPELLEQARLRARVTPLEDDVVGEAGRALWLLLGGMAFLLVIASANVANLFLVRAEHKRREVAVRTALGAGGHDLFRFVAAESVLLASLGGALGLLGAGAGVEILLAFIPPEGLPRLHEVALGGRVIAFAVGLSLLVAVTLASVPGFRHARHDIGSVLREGTSASTATRTRHRARGLLVTGQLALALTLLIGSALMVQSVQRLHRVDLGFDRDGVLTAEIAMPFRGYEDYGSVHRLWDDLITRVSALPGVEAAGSVSGLPLVPKPAYYDLAIDVEERPGETYSGVTLYFASPGYFETMRMPVLEGEAIASAVTAERPIVLSASAARRLFAGGEAIGKRLRRAAGPGTWLTVVAVVGDVPAHHVGGDPADIVYVPILETAVEPGLSPGQGALVVRASVPPVSLAPGVREIVRSLDANLPVANVRTMTNIVADSTARTTFTLLLLLVASVAALFLGVVGVYGVTSYAVGRRTREIGLRIALGARPRDVERMVLGETTGLVLGGVALGALAALGLTRFMGTLLFEISPTDPGSYGAMAFLLLVTAVIASWMPARRAARADPQRALRCD
jgi:predicted permease